MTLARLCIELAKPHVSSSFRKERGMSPSTIGEAVGVTLSLSSGRGKGALNLRREEQEGAQEPERVRLPPGTDAVWPHDTSAAAIAVLEWGVAFFFFGAWVTQAELKSVMVIPNHIAAT